MIRHSSLLAAVAVLASCTANPADNAGRKASSRDPAKSCGLMTGNWLHKKTNHGFAISQAGAVMTAKLDEGGVFSGPCNEGVMDTGHEETGPIIYIPSRDQVVFMGMVLDRQD